MENVAKDVVTKKRALITGGSSGIGRGIAIVLAQAGYDLAITYDTNKAGAEETAARIHSQNGGKCLIFQAGLHKHDVPAPLVDAAIKGLGGLDLLVNNAGLTMTGNFVDMKYETIAKLINLDLWAYILSSQAAARYFLANKIAGNIINITSTRAQRAYPEDAVYGAVKAGVERFSASLALELAPVGARVNCIAPGATREQSKPLPPQYHHLPERIPLRRMGRPEDIGHAVAWLASDKASYITGTVIRIDGGLILPGMPEKTMLDPTQGWGA